MYVTLSDNVSEMQIQDIYQIQRVVSYNAFLIITLKEKNWTIAVLTITHLKYMVIDLQISSGDVRLLIIYIER